MSGLGESGLREKVEMCARGHLWLRPASMDGAPCPWCFGPFYRVAAVMPSPAYWIDAEPLPTATLRTVDYRRANVRVSRGRQLPTWVLA